MKKKNEKRKQGDIEHLKAAVQKYEELNDAIFESLKDHISVLDMGGKIISVNGPWTRFAQENGVANLEAISPGTNYIEACQCAVDEHDRVAQEVIDGIESVLKEERPDFSAEYPCHSPSEKRWFRVTITPLKSKNGGAVVVHSDITERKKAELELKEALAENEQLKNRLYAENIYLQEEITSEYDFEGIVGNSDELHSVLAMVEHVAVTDTTVLILGETGTGKELIARAIHSRSSFHEHPLVKVNCAALSPSLIESELFGHEKGAFTGATAKRIGRFELADGGTIFLDEIGDISPEIQAKLLRVLQEGEFEPLGSSKTRKVSVRVIAATNRNLAEAVREGAFRKDLYYRLRIFPVEIPPLHERREDVPLLVWHFITRNQGRLGKKIEKIPKKVMNALQAYDWPGNVRELENIIERALILSPGKTLQLDESLGISEDNEPSESSQLEAVARGHILKVLKDCGWKVKGEGNAAERLGLKPSTLRFRMKKLGIERAGGKP